MESRENNAQRQIFIEIRPSSSPLEGEARATRGSSFHPLRVPIVISTSRDLRTLRSCGSMDNKDRKGETRISLRTCLASWSR